MYLNVTSMYESTFPGSKIINRRCGNITLQLNVLHNYANIIGYMIKSECLSCERCSCVSSLLPALTNNVAI